jgi:predicted nucleotidyltransferase
MMKQSFEIKQKLQEQKILLFKEYGVRDMGLFGSLIKGGATSSSDIDILVDFSRPIDLFAFVELKNHLSELLDAHVDLVMKKGLKPGIGKQILAEVEYI